MTHKKLVIIITEDTDESGMRSVYTEEIGDRELINVVYINYLDDLRRNLNTNLE